MATPLGWHAAELVGCCPEARQNAKGTQARTLSITIRNTNIERDTTMSTAVDNLAMQIRDMVSLAVEEENVTITEVPFILLTAAIATLSGVERAEETAALLSGIAKRSEKEGYDAFEGHCRRQAQ
jgi:hypothetical protein